jgi:tetratricopeptide (TPR) repeat protein
MRRLAAFGLAVAAATIAVYAQTGGYNFVGYDDSGFILLNPEIRAGLTVHGVGWAFTTFFGDMWTPLTWLSWMIDAEIFGVNAGAFHLINLALHVVAALTMYFALRRMTKAPWRSAVVAAIFALHPLHVESVAWATERKDVLSGFFAALSLLFYARYTEVPEPRRYLAAAAAFTLGLMAKATLVTLPMVFLLLDVWPLKRLPLPLEGRSLRRLVLEKLPLFALSAAACVLAVVGHRIGRVQDASGDLPFSAHLANAIVNDVVYLRKAFFPTDLAVLYPYHPPAGGSVAAALVFLAAITYRALAVSRQYPYLAVGWLWFLGMLVPVGGVLIDGVQAMADRYMYLPSVGLSLAIVWGLADLAAARRVPRAAVAVVTGVVLALFAAQAYRQTEYWSNSRVLFEHTLAVTGDNPRIHFLLGNALQAKERHDEAIRQYRAAVEEKPDFADAHNSLGVALAQTGHTRDALPEFLEAERLLRSRDPGNENNLCLAYETLGQLDEAERHCKKALELMPDYPAARASLGKVQAARNRQPADEPLRRKAAPW